MSGVSTTSAAVPAGLGALLGVAPEGSGFGGSTGKAPSSFGAALALAERLLDAGADMTMLADAASATSSEVSPSAQSADGSPQIDAAPEGEAALDAGPSPTIAVLAAPPIPPPAETAPHSVAAEGGGAEDAPAVSAAQNADVPPITDADAPVITAASGAADARARDAQPVARPAVPAAPETAPDARVARAESVSAPSSTAAASSDVLPAPSTTTVSKDAGVRQDQPAPLTPTASATAPAASVSPTSAPVLTTPETAAAVPRAVAAQVAPVVLSIVQRPVGSHQLTMTVNPDTLGPVTVRAHIGVGGEVRVELLGATEAGRDALRTIVTDLRRDLAAVMPHASLTLGSSTSADAGGSERGAQPGSAGAAGEHASGEHASGERGRAPLDGRPSVAGRAGGIPSLPTTTRAVAGEGLDIFA